MGHYFNPNLPKDNLHWIVDASNFRSYPGSGAAWRNLVFMGVNDLTNTNTPTFSSVGATSYFSYNGTTQYSAKASVTDGALVQGPITINVIFNPSSSSATYNAIALLSGASNSVQIGYRSDISSGAVWKNGGTALLTYPTVGIGTVCHITYTCDGSNNSKIYVNGALYASGTVATNTGAATNYTVASFNSGAGEFLNGRVYYASVYKKVFTDQEVADTWHALKRRFGYAGIGTNPFTGDPTTEPVGGGGGPQ